EDRAAAVVIVSERMWVSRFDQDPNVIGRRLVVGGVYCDVLGVMPTAFAMPSSSIDVWIPLDMLATISGTQMRERGVFQVVGRLQPGVTIRQAEEDARRVSIEISNADNRDVHVARIADDLIRDV